jgi:hypothetical protein
MPFFIVFTGPIINLFSAENSVFRGLCHTELDDLLSRYLDCLTSLGVPTHTSLTLHEYNLTDAGKSEGILGLLVCEFCDFVKDDHCLRLLNVCLLRKVFYDLRLCHNFSHDTSFG